MWLPVGLLGVIGAGVTVARAQQISAGGFGGRTPPRFPTATTVDGSLNFCRVMSRSDRRELQLNRLGGDTTLDTWFSREIDPLVIAGKVRRGT